jgi:hypothetical protein
VRPLTLFSTLTALLLTAPAALAEEAGLDLSVSVGDAQPSDEPDAERATGYSADHPLSLGVRSGAWIQRQIEPGVGGFLRFRPFSWLAAEASTDHYFALDGTRRDHLVGLDLLFPFLGDERFSFGPSVGGTLAVRVSEAAAPSSATVYQLLLGGRAGVTGEVFLVDGLAAFASAQAGLFVGQNARVLLTENEIAVTGNVFLEPVGLVAAGASYSF